MSSSSQDFHRKAGYRSKRTQDHRRRRSAEDQLYVVKHPPAQTDLTRTEISLDGYEEDMAVSNQVEDMWIWCTRQVQPLCLDWQTGAGRVSRMP